LLAPSRACPQARFCTEYHDEHSLDTWIKYRHYAPQVPVTALYTATAAASGRWMARCGLWPLDVSFGRLRVARLVCWSPGADDRRGLVRARSDAGAVPHVLSLGESADPARPAQRLFEGLLLLLRSRELSVYLCKRSLRSVRAGVHRTWSKKAAERCLRLVDM